MSSLLRAKPLPIVVSCVLLALLALRFLAPDKDPPVAYIYYGQTLISDPYHLTFAARNATLFDDWVPFDYHRWDVFKNSLISGVAYVTFNAFGVSRTAANIAGILLSTGGILLFLCGFLGRRALTEISITAAILLLNNLLFVYGRLPFLETGLVFLSGCLFCIFMHFHDRWWGQFLSGMLVALAALCGKLFGVLLIAPVAISLIYRYRSRSAVPILLAGSGIVAGAAMIHVILYGGDMSTLAQYYQEHTTGMYGIPPGLTSVSKGLKSLVTYGADSGLWDFAPVQLVLVSCGVILAMLCFSPRDHFTAKDLPLLFCLIWLLLGIAGLAPFQYRPARYALFLLLPAGAMAGFAVDFAMSKSAKCRLRDRFFTLPLTLLVFWYSVMQVFMIFTPLGDELNSLRTYLPISGLLAAMATLSLMVPFLKTKEIRVPRWMGYAMMALLVASAIVDGRLLWRALIEPGRELAQINREVAAIVDRGAVLTGPLMPAFTIDNELRGVIHAFGLPNPDPSIVSRFNISHVLINRIDLDATAREIPELSGVLPIAEFPLQHQVMALYRLPQSTVPMTDFERGADHLNNRQSDLAILEFGHFYAAHPHSILGNCNLALALTVNERYADADKILRSISSKYPDNYILHIGCQYVYERMFKATQSPEYLRLAREHAECGEELGLPAKSTLE